MKTARWVLASLLLTLAAAPAWATDQFARVNEVMLSYGGDSTKQLIEIEDMGGDTFDGGGYVLFVYEANGVDQAQFQTLPLTAGTTRVTFATPSAVSQFGLVPTTNPPDIIINLANQLPAAGTACFRKQGVDLHCLSWGAVTAPRTAPTNGIVAGPAPTDNMSLQRQTTGNCAGIGAPTPDAANATLTCVDPPGMSGTDGGMGSGSNGGGGGGDCSASAGGSWFGFVATASLFGYARVRRGRGRRRIA